MNGLTSVMLTGGAWVYFRENRISSWMNSGLKSMVVGEEVLVENGPIDLHFPNQLRGKWGGLLLRVEATYTGASWQVKLRIKVKPVSSCFWRWHLHSQLRFCVAFNKG